ncbi:hypothetical protein BOX15_Mlig015119g5 [Macrostomum lignano]|uniref:Uncharacterized protein n=1 Tax=Macrostomum lignano TaxID=282301 RepID=A0A267FWV7_9PLAT|nr:hypothetical protein BOX15_Mlig015119g5 [Macrostomum lignano]
MVRIKKILLLSKGLIQLFLFIGCLIRYNLFSLVYLLFLLLSPFVSFSKEYSFLLYNAILIVCSGIFALSSAAFQTVLAVNPPYGRLVNDCQIDQKWRLIGLQRLDNAEPHDAARLLLPDPLLLLAACVLLATVRSRRRDCFQRQQQQQQQQQQQEASSSTSSPEADAYNSLLLRFTACGGSRIFHLALMCAAAVCSPSLLASPYILAFVINLFLRSICPANARRRRIEGAVARCLMLYAFIHLLAHYCYQLPAVHYNSAGNSTQARLLGLHYLLQNYCPSPQIVFSSTARVNEYAAPLLLLCFYFCTCLLLRMHRWELSRLPVPGARAATFSSSNILETGRAAGDNADGSRLLPVEEDQPAASQQPQQRLEAAKTAAERAAAFTSEACQRLLIRCLTWLQCRLGRVSHIGALIGAMCWSVTYVSLATLPFLLLACLLWVLPGTRRSTLTLSPLLAAYGTVLLLSNYAFNFQLPEVYLARFNESQLAQAGLQVYTRPMRSLAMQSLFCCSFYFALSVLLTERGIRRSSGSGAVGGGGGGLPLNYMSSALPAATLATSTTSLVGATVSRLENLAKTLLPRYSLLLCCLFWLLVCTRTKVSISHVIVMAIFLYFVFCFCVSYSFWKRQVLPLLVVVISYSMLSLLVIYAYQFESVPEFITRVTGLQQSTLRQIGIEKYETPQLFLNLLFPTSFIIVIMIHLKNFHKHFINIGHNGEPAAAAASGNRSDGRNRRGNNYMRRARGRAARSSRFDVPDRSAPQASTAATTAEQQRQHGEEPPQPSDSASNGPEWLFAKAAKLHGYYTSRLEPTLWRLLELHSHRAIGLLIVCMASRPLANTGNFDASNAVYMLLMPLYLLLPRFVSIIYLAWSSIIILAKMIYQLELVREALQPYVISNCTTDMILPDPPSAATYLPTQLSDNLLYFGLFVSPDPAQFAPAQVALVACLACQHLIRRYCRHRRKQSSTGVAGAQEDDPTPASAHLVFPAFTFRAFEQFYTSRMAAAVVTSGGGDCLVVPPAQAAEQQRGLPHSLASAAVQFIANFGCYKLGLELSYFALVVCACLRVDALSCLYLGLLLVFGFLSRPATGRFWPLLHLLLGLAFGLQFCLACGLPPFLCLRYPWFTPANCGLFTDNLRQWLFLPAYNVPPRAEKLIADYFVLVLVTCQSRVFQLESSAGGRAGGVTRDTCMGSNNPVWRDMATETRLRCSFISAKSSELLGFLFRLVFCWLFWACSLLLLVLGFLSFNLFSFLYILVAFYLLANGHRFLLQKRRRLIRLWNLVLGLNVFVMLCKCALQLVGCSVSLNANARPWMRQLLRIQCLNMHVFDDYVALDKDWDDTVNNPGIAMDIVCFILLVIQKRVFLTRYFTEVRLDTELQSSFMSKGARIITLTLRRIWYENKRLEENEISYIRRKVDTLRPRQRQGRELTEHFLMVRSGTKDMFFKTDAQGRRRLSLDETDGQKDEPPNPQQLHSNAAEILFEQSLLKVTEFAHKPSLALRKAMVSLHRRQSRASGLDDDQAKRQSSERHTASPIPSMSDDNLAASSAAPLGRTSPFPLAIPEVELEADANEEDEDDAQSDVFDGISASAAVSGNLGAAVASADNLAAAAALATTADELDHLSSKTELASEVSDEKMMALTESLLDKIMYGLERICQALDRATADYRNIEEQISRSKLQAKCLRLETAQQASGDGEAVSDGLLTDRLLQLTIDPMPREQIESADDAHESAPPRPLPLPNGWWDAISRLFQLLQYLLLSRVTQLCYTLMVAYHLFHMSIFSLVYPIIVFTWGMLSWPYPTKRFWYSAIVYTMMWILARYCLQFILLKDLVRQDSAGFVGWLAKEMNVRPEYSTPAAELILLAVLFLQRSTLKRFGLWDISRKNLQPASADPSPEKPTQQQQQNLPTAADSSSSSSALPPLSSPTIRVRRRKAKSQLLSRSQQPPPSDADEASSMLPPGELSDEQRPPSPPPPESTLATPSISSAAAVVNFFHRLATFHSAREFFKKVSGKENFSIRVELYSWMFASEFVSLLIIFFGYTKGFAEEGTAEDTTIITYFSKEEFPLALIVTLFIQFIIILVDRALFLTKSRRGKFFFHIGHVILLHAYLKFILPAMSSHNYIAESSVIKLFYASKCIYFALSAYQILSGYPSRILGNFICKRHNYLNLFSFKGYMLVPFLFELRSVMDWMLTNTALGISHWLLMEEIYSTVFVAKCWRRAEIAYPTERAKNRPPVYKYCPGMWLMLLIIACIWAPLLWFSVMSNVFLEENAVTACTSELSLGSYTPLYTLKTTSVRNLTAAETDIVYQCFSGANETEQTRKRVQALLSSTTAYSVEFDGMSSVLWTITPPSREALRAELQNNATLNLYFKVECLRDKDNGVARKYVFQNPLPPDVSSDLLSVLHPASDNASVVFRQIGHRFLLMRASESTWSSGGGRGGGRGGGGGGSGGGGAGGPTLADDSIELLARSLPAGPLSTSRIDIQAALNSTIGGIAWWQLSDLYCGSPLCPAQSDSGCAPRRHGGLRIVVLSERSKSQNRLIQAIQKVGMYGVLSVFLISVARILRSGIVPVHYLVPYVDMPHVDRILSLLNDIYLVRESGELRLEEELFAKLLFLYRSPSMLVHFTELPESVLAQFYKPDSEAATEQPPEEGQPATSSQ